MLLDQYGQKIEAAKLSISQSDAQPERHWRFSSSALAVGHSALRGLTPQQLNELLDAAVNGNLGIQARLFDLMIERDAHIAAEFDKRKRAPISVPWQIVPPPGGLARSKRLAQEVQEWVEALPNFDDLIMDLMNAAGYGFACTEIEWQRWGEYWYPASFNAFEAREFSFPPRSEWMSRRAGYTRADIRLGSGEQAEPLWPAKWIVHIVSARAGNLAKAAMFRALAWPFLYKHYALRDFAEFLEIMGIPMRIAKVPPHMDAVTQQQLLMRLKDLGHSGAAVIPDGADIAFHNSVGSQPDAFRAMIDYMDAKISGVILGTRAMVTANGLNGGASANEVNNAEVRREIREADCRQLADTLNRDLIAPWCILNKGISDPAQMPRLKFLTREPEELAVYADALPKLAAVGVRIPVAWAQDKLMIPEPQDGEPVLAARDEVLPPFARADDQPRQQQAQAKMTVPPDAASLKVDATASDRLDELVNEAMAGWEPQLTPMLDPVQALFKRADDENWTAKQLIDALPTVLHDMDVQALTRALAQAAFVARLAGVHGREPDHAGTDRG